MPNDPAKSTLMRTKIPAELLKQFDQEAEFIRVPPGSVAGLIRVSPEMIQKMGAAQFAKMLQQSNCELVMMGQEVTR